MKIRSLAAAITALSLIGFIALMPAPVETVLPNGFVIQGNTVILSSDRRVVLSNDAEFICFDDRFLIVTSLRDGKRGLLDSQSQRQIEEHSQPELNAPDGLLHGPNNCNGYYTRMMGPGLLHDNGEWPFIPSCESVNRGNLSLGDRAWLNRPCATR